MRLQLPWIFPKAAHGAVMWRGPRLKKALPYSWFIFNRDDECWGFFPNPLSILFHLGVLLPFRNGCHRLVSVSGRGDWPLLSALSNNLGAATPESSLEATVTSSKTSKYQQNKRRFFCFALLSIYKNVPTCLSITSEQTSCNSES